MNDPIRTDVVIIGAGPVGLFASFELGLFGMRCHLVDALGRPGGQCTELYPDKPIYDIPGQPSILAQGLVDSLLEQIAPFEPGFTFGRTITEIGRCDDGWFRLTTDGGEALMARLVVIAAGGGSFQPRRPAIPGIEAFEGTSVFYSVRRVDDFRGHDLLVVGSDDPAVRWAVHMAPVVSSLSLAHRQAELHAAPDDMSRARSLEEEGRLRCHVGELTSLRGAGGELHAAIVSGAGGDIEVRCSRLLGFFGLTMKIGPYAEWGLNLHDGLVVVDTERFETSVPGIFAIGDVNWYPGKLKLILSGFHEAALMAQAARRILKPGERSVIQYTTSSKSLQKMLGVR